MMVEEQTFACVECGYLCHFFICKFKVEDVEILLHALYVNRLRYYYHATLNQSAQCNLCHALAVTVACLCESFVAEQIVAAFRKRTP